MDVPSLSGSLTRPVVRRMAIKMNNLYSDCIHFAEGNFTGALNIEDEEHTDPTTELRWFSSMKYSSDVNLIRQFWLILYSTWNRKPRVVMNNQGSA